MAIRVEKEMVGRINGKVILRCIRKLPAPSKRAAS